MDSTLPSQPSPPPILMPSESQVQCTSGFSVAFGSTGCRGLAGRLMPQVKCWVPESKTSRGIRGAYILIPITGLSKMQFPAFSRMELVFREGTSRHQKMLTKKKWHVWFGNYNCRFAVVLFYFINNERKRFSHFKKQLFWVLTTRCYMSDNQTLCPASGLKWNPHQ